MKRRESSQELSITETRREVIPLQPRLLTQEEVGVLRSLFYCPYARNAFEVYRGYLTFEVGEAPPLPDKEVRAFVQEQRKAGSRLVDYRTIQRILEDMAAVGWVQKRTGALGNAKAVYSIPEGEVLAKLQEYFKPEQELVQSRNKELGKSRPRFRRSIPRP